MAKYSYIVAAAVALAVSALLGFVLIPMLHRVHFGQTIKEIGPVWHKKKQGTPTMGGFLFILGGLAGLAAGYGMLTGSALLGADHLREHLDLLIGVIMSLAFGLVGFADDYIKVIKKRNLGLLARYKILFQVLVTAAFLASLSINGTLSTLVWLPLFGYIDLGYWYYPLAFLLIIGIVNGVNLTDGIDGLNGSVTFVVCLGYMVMGAVWGHFAIGLYAAAMAGALVGYLIWNFHPAKVFMGDVGSLFLGGVVVALAYGIGRPESLFLMGIVYILEDLSDVLQVGYFKLTHGKRIFKMAPIHHHFEMSGWSESKIVGVFSAVAALGVVAAFACMAAI